MSQDLRVIYNGADITKAVVDFRAGTQSFHYLVGQYLYVGSVMPFNNLFFEVQPHNNNAATASVDMWFGQQWTPAVDLRDETNGMANTGRLSWATDRLKGWDREETSEDVTGLSAFKVYWKYWARLSWSAEFSNNTAIRYLGQKFSEDAVLYTYYPDLNNTDILTGFATGKTNWNDQHYMAAERIIADLKKGDIVISSSQIMDWTQYEEASCHKVAEIVYKAFGQPYSDQLKRARDDYTAAMNVKYPLIDVNGNGSPDPVERRLSTNFMTR